MRHPWIAAIIIATLLILFRITTAQDPDLANFSPFAALFFCGAAFWSTNKLLLPTAMLAWLISGPIVSSLQGYPAFHVTSLFTVLGFAAIVCVGFMIKNKSVDKLVFGTIVGATLFYLITNTASFVTDPQYPKTLQGFTQSLWTGSPLATTPTWAFFRNSLVANTLCTSLFLALMHIPVIQKKTQFSLSSSKA